MIEQGDGSKAKIIVTQPRRISAITVAKRVAEERGEVFHSLSSLLVIFEGKLLKLVFLIHLFGKEAYRNLWES